MYEQGLPEPGGGFGCGALQVSLVAVERHVRCVLENRKFLVEDRLGVECVNFEVPVGEVIAFGNIISVGVF